MDSTGTATIPVDAADAAGSAVEDPQPVVLEQELLVEDVSIDGMCGVY